MPAELAVAYVSLVPSARGLSRAIHKELVGPTGRVAGEAGHAAGKTFGNRFTGAVSTIAKAGALGLAGVAVVATKLVVDAISGAEDARKIANQTNEVIRSTGGVAHISARQVGGLVDALSAKAGVDDELIQSGANVLLTFTKVRNEVGAGNDIFNQATTVALDMSVALGQDLQSSVTQIGKALNDPIAGLASLTRVGVQFTDQQKEQIRTLVESGDVLGAQKVILAELTTQFGGSAEAQATATDKLKVAFGNMSEAIGGVLLPYVDRFADWMLTEGVPLLEDKLVPAVGDLADWIADTLVPAIRDELLPRLADFATFVRDELLPRLADIGTWIRDEVVPPLQTMWGIFKDDILPVFSDVATFVKDKLVPPLEDLKDALFGVNDEAGDSGPNLAGWAGALAAVGLGAAFVVSKLAFLAPLVKGIGLVFGQAFAIVTYVAQLFAAVVVQGLILSPLYKVIAAVFIFRDEVGAAFTWVYQHAILPIGRAFEDLWGVITRAVGSIVDFVKRNWTSIGTILFAPVGIAVGLIIVFWDKIRAAFFVGVDFVKRIWSAAWDAVTSRLNAWWDTAYAFFTALPGRLAGFFVNAASWLVAGGRGIMTGLWNGLKAVWGALWAWFGGVDDALIGFFWNAWTWLVTAGRWIISGLKNGITAAVDAIGDFLGGIKDKIVDGFKAVFGISSPSSVMMGIGTAIMQGLLVGMFGSVGQLKDFIKNIGLTIGDLAQIVGESNLVQALLGPGFGVLKDVFGDVWGSLFGGNPGDFGAVADMATAAHGLVGAAALANQIFRNLFPGMTIGGWRARGSVPGSDHPKGKALDLMTTDPTRAAQIISIFKGMLGAKYWIWNRQIATAAGGWAPRGYSGPSPHTDHVHLSFFGKGGVADYTGLAFLHRNETVFTPDQMRVLGSVIAAGGDDPVGDGTVARGVVVEQHNYGITDYAELARRSADELAWTMRVAG